jgi:hypothetical protein
MDGVSLDALMMMRTSWVARWKDKVSQDLKGLICIERDQGFSRVRGGFRRDVLSRLAVKLERLSARCIS